MRVAGNRVTGRPAWRGGKASSDLEPCRFAPAPAPLREVPDTAPCRSETKT